MSFAQNLPIDWTNGTGTIGNSGTLTIPPAAGRSDVYVQNQDTGPLTVAYQAQKAGDGTACTVSILLGPGATHASQGSSDERVIAGGFVPTGTITVTGTLGQAACVMTAGA